MSVLYKLQKVNITTNSSYGKWYAHAIITGTVDTNALAEVMQRNCTVKKSDILAVLTELVETMQDQLQNSMRVRLNGIGAFKIGLKTKVADKAEDFNVSKNVVGMKVLFYPETHIDRNHYRNQALLQSATVKETAKNAVISK